jgi:endonuclease/exonuclease/phosphatase family metal-dependent hydrolase
LCAIGTILARDWVVVAGDFNDAARSAPLRGLVTMRGLVDVLARQFRSDMTARWTYRSGQQLDYLLVSTPLARAMTTAGVERRDIYGAAPALGNGEWFETVTSATTAASDHGAVWADLGLG